MTENLLILILSIGMAIFHNVNKPIPYVLNMEDGSNESIIIQKNNEYACPINCGVDHIHHAIMCNNENEVHNNQFGEVGFDPDLETGELASIIFELSNGKMPDIFWDGVLPFFQMIFGQPKDEKLVMRNNGDASFLAINPIKFFFSMSDPITRKQEIFKGEIKPLSPITIEMPKAL